MTPPSAKSWYAAGLRFDCRRCGNCCSGPTGVVRFTTDELKAMAAHVGLLPFEFLRRHARQDERGHWSLAERPRAPDRTSAGAADEREEEAEEEQFDCTFLARDEAGRATCTIHPVRPTQCRTWPFWPENLTGPERWREVAEGCRGVAEGIEGDGTRHDADEIDRRRDLTPPA